MADPILPNAASYLQLYSDGDARASNEVQCEVKAANVIWKDAVATRDWKFKANAFKFSTAAGLQEFDLRVELDAADSAAAAAQAAADAAQADSDAEAVRAIAAEGGISGLLQAEISRAGTAEAANSAATVAEAARAAAAEAALDAAYKAADAALQVNISAEETRATAAEQANATAISNIIGTSPDNLNSLTELVVAYTNMDSAQSDLLVALSADVAEIRAELDQLLNI